MARSSVHGMPTSFLYLYLGKTGRSASGYESKSFSEFCHARWLDGYRVMTLMMAIDREQVDDETVQLTLPGSGCPCRFYSWSTVDWRPAGQLSTVLSVLASLHFRSWRSPPASFLALEQLTDSRVSSHDAVTSVKLWLQD